MHLNTKINCETRIWEIILGSNRSIGNDITAILNISRWHPSLVNAKVCEFSNRYLITNSKNGRDGLRLYPRYVIKLYTVLESKRVMCKAAICRNATSCLHLHKTKCI